MTGAPDRCAGMKATDNQLDVWIWMMIGTIYDRPSVLRLLRLRFVHAPDPVARAYDDAVDAFTTWILEDTLGQQELRQLAKLASLAKTDRDNASFLLSGLAEREPAGAYRALLTAFLGWVEAIENHEANAHVHV